MPARLNAYKDKVVTGSPPRIGTEAEDGQPAGHERGRVLRLLAVAACLVVMSAAAATLIGWLTGIGELRSFLPTTVRTKPNAAVALLLCGSALLVQLGRHAPRRFLLLGQIAAAVVAGIGFLTFLEYLTGLDIHLDRVLFADRIAPDGSTTIPGRMAPTTAIGLVLLGTALLLRPHEWRQGLLPEVLAGGAFGLGFLGLLGYLYGAPSLYQWGVYTSMAPDTAALLLIQALAIMVTLPRGRMFAMLTSDGLGAATYRRILPLVVLIPVVGGALELWGQRQGFYGSQYGIGLLVIGTASLLAAIGWHTAHVLTGLDHQRSAMTQQLEELVKDRTAELDESYAQVRTVIDRSPLSIVTMDYQGVITGWNPKAETTFGWAAEEVVGRVLTETIIPSEYREAHRAVLARDHATGVGPVLDRVVELTALRKDGSTFPVELAISAAHASPSPVTFVAFLHDITDRKASAGVESERLALIEHAPVSVGKVSPEGRVLDVNPATCQMLGYTREELLSFTAAEVTRYDDLEASDKLYAKLAAGEGTSATIHKRYRRKDGSEFWGELTVAPVRDGNGRVLYFVTMMQDVSERKAREEAESGRRALVEHAPLGIERVSPSGHLLDVNPAFCSMLGYTRDELVQLTVADVTSEDDIDATRQLYAETAVGSQRGVLEKRYLRKDGSKFWGALTVAPVRVSDGSIAYFVTMIEDITERRERALELERSNAELDQFAYVASHDLQEPLRMVTSYVQLLARRYRGQLDADADEFIGYAVDGAVRMQALISDLLLYARVGSKGKEMVTTDADAALDAALRNLQARITETEAVVTRTPLPQVIGDAGQLAQLFQNLIGNAVKFHNAEAPRVRVTSGLEDGMLRVSIEDNGIGIDPLFADRIFTVFQRLHGRSEYPGNGIGLSICKKIVERHGGKIWVESAPGHGSTFSFTLRPAIASQTIAGSAHRLPQPQHSREVSK